MHVLAAIAATNLKRHGPYIISTVHCPSGPSFSDAEQSALAGDVVSTNARSLLSLHFH